MNVLMLEDFLRGVAEGSPAGASGVDGLRALEIVLAAYGSGRITSPGPWNGQRSRSRNRRRSMGSGLSSTRCVTQAFRLDE